MKRILTILTFILTISASGQTYTPFPTTNTTWCSDFQTESPFPPYSIYHYYVFYKTNGDTVIDNNTYTIISRYQGLSNYCFLREDSNKVYCRYSQPDTTEFVLYNFNLHAGDTTLLPMYNGELFYQDATVYSEDSILIGNKQHRRIRIISWIMIDFIEGIGSAQGLFYSEIPWVDVGGELNCFSKNDTIYSIDGSGSISTGNCYQFIGISDNNINDQKVIYPNPTSGYIFINYEGFQRFELYNSLGQEFLNSTVPYADMHEFPSGIYFIKIIGELHNKIIVQRIIKE